VSVTIRKRGRHLAGQRSINVRITDGPSDLANLDYLPGFGYDLSPYGHDVLEQVKTIVRTFENQFYVHDIGPDLYLHFAARVFYTMGLLTKLREKELSRIPKTFSDTLNASATAHIREMALKDLQVAGLYGDTLGWHDCAGPERDAAEANAIRTWWRMNSDPQDIRSRIVKDNPVAELVLCLPCFPSRQESDKVYDALVSWDRATPLTQQEAFRKVLDATGRTVSNDMTQALWNQCIQRMFHGFNTSGSILDLLNAVKQMFPDPMHVNVEYALTQWPLVRDSIFYPSTIRGPTADYALVDDIRLGA